MMEDRYSPEHQETEPRIPEARYAYYRRCQVFRKGGEQCKAPAEKGSHICYAHAGQLAMAVRRERERHTVLAEAVAQMRKRGRPDCEMADLFMDLKGINVTVSVMAKALIAGRIDCKTAGRLVVQLQTVSKLLRKLHRTKTQNLPLINADNADLKELVKEPNLTAEARRHGDAPKNLPLINADDTDLRKPAEEANLGAESSRHEEEPSLTAEARRRRDEPKDLPLINTDDSDLKKMRETANLKAEFSRGREQSDAGSDRAVNERERTRIALVTGVMAIANRRGWAHAPPELLIAA